MHQSSIRNDSNDEENIKFKNINNHGKALYVNSHPQNDDETAKFGSINKYELSN